MQQKQPSLRRARNFSCNLGKTRGTGDNKARPLVSSGLTADNLPRVVAAFLRHCEIVRHSSRTIGNRRLFLGKLVWFVQTRGHDTIDRDTLEEFFCYLNQGHKEKGGRWGNPKEKSPVTSGTVKAYYSSLRAFFNWCCADDRITASPMIRMDVPIDRPDQVAPFSSEHIKALFAAVVKTDYPTRDYGILMLLLDTGVRASELTGLRVEDLDLDGCAITVRHGKGNKARIIPIASATRKALFNHLSERDYLPEDPLFVSERGHRAGDNLTRYGLLALFRRLKATTGIKGVRVSPHTMRHTFAINFLRNGGNVFTLKTLLGHESLVIVNRYVALAQADVEKQHQQFSPVAGMISAGVIGTGKSRGRTKP